MAAEGLVEQHLEQGHARPARGVEGDAPHLGEGHAVVEVDRAHGAPAADGDARHDGVVAEGVLDGRDHPQVALPAVELLGHPRGNVAFEAEVLLVREAINQRLGVQVGHDPEPENAPFPFLLCVSVPLWLG